MTSFYYKAVGSDGKVRAGSLAGENEKLVARELRKQGLVPVYVGLNKKIGGELRLPQFHFGKRKDVLFFTQELSTLLGAGVPLDRALQISGELTERTKFRSIILDVLRTLKGGRSFADSLATHPEYFTDLYVNMVRAGEASGSLVTVFERLTEFEKTRDELRGYIVSSLIYPALLTMVGLGSIFILLNFVVPRFASIFADGTMKMPLPTKIMLDASAIVREYSPPFFGGLALVLIALSYYVHTPKGRLWWDSLRLRVPLLGLAMRKAETANFARAMGTLVANGVPLVQCIQISRAILTNRRIAGSLEGVAQGVKRGEGIAGPLSRAGEFPALAGHLLSVGEETGRLDEMFKQMAEIYEADTKNSIKRFTALFEPLVILVMGVMVGALILSMLLAITSINDVAM